MADTPTIPPSPVADTMNITISRPNPQHPPGRPPIQFLDLPAETRAQILEMALLADAYECKDLYWKLPHPFDRPVVVIHDQAYKDRISTRPGYDAFWGSKKMTRLMLVSKSLHDEVSDIIYSRFAIYVVPWRTWTHLQDWASRMKRHHSLAVQNIRHYHLIVTLLGFLDGGLNTNDISDGVLQNKLIYLEELSKAFPNLTSVRMQMHFRESSLLNDSSFLMKQTEKIMTLVEFWHRLNVAVIVFPDYCAGKMARGIVAEAQKRLRQKQIHPLMYDQETRCPHEHSGIGCGMWIGHEPSE